MCAHVKVKKRTLLSLYPAGACGPYPCRDREFMVHPSPLSSLSLWVRPSSECTVPCAHASAVATGTARYAELWGYTLYKYLF